MTIWWQFAIKWERYIFDYFSRWIEYSERWGQHWCGILAIFKIGHRFYHGTFRISLLNDRIEHEILIVELDGNMDGILYSIIVSTTREVRPMKVKINRITQKKNPRAGETGTGSSDNGGIVDAVRCSSRKPSNSVGILKLITPI